MAAPYIVPFVLYLLGTSFIARFGDEWYPLAYSSVVVVVGIATVYLLRGKKLFQPHWKVGWGLLFGLVGIALWIAFSHLQLERQAAALLPSFLSFLKPGERVSYNPFEALGYGVAGWGFISIRLVGIAVLVPIAEELFWRGFLLRWIIDPEWERVSLGEYTWQSCALVTLMFTLAHPEWLAAATYCLLINALLYWKKDLWLCIVAHATSNLALALYVLATGTWWLW